jgi:hypothetical protein
VEVLYPTFFESITLNFVNKVIEIDIFTLSLAMMVVSNQLFSPVGVVNHISPHRGLDLSINQLAMLILH